MVEAKKNSIVSRDHQDRREINNKTNFKEEEIVFEKLIYATRIISRSREIREKSCQEKRKLRYLTLRSLLFSNTVGAVMRQRGLLKLIWRSVPLNVTDQSV